MTVTNRMSQLISTTPNEALTEAEQEKIVRCLIRFANLAPDHISARIIPLTPDASTRKYFRVPVTNDAHAIASLYAESFDPETQPFLDVTRLFESENLPVPRILAVDAELGIIIQEDLGDNQLINALQNASPQDAESLTENAIDLIIRIQAATRAAHEQKSIAARQAFDYEKLVWELNYFQTHFFGSYRRTPLAETSPVREELDTLARELALRPRVLCHRDLHGANIIVDKENNLRLIDYQDARMGTASYDLVTLLTDRQLAAPPRASLRERRAYFLERRQQHGLPAIDSHEFACEFRLTTIQRGLKAVGSFSYLTAINGRGEVYEKYIAPQFELVLQAARRLNRFPHLQRELEKQLSEIN